MSESTYRLPLWGRVPDTPTDESIKHIIDWLQRCPHCGGQHKAWCHVCKAAGLLFWCDGPEQYEEDKWRTLTNHWEATGGL